MKGERVWNDAVLGDLQRRSDDARAHLVGILDALGKEQERSLLSKVRFGSKSVEYRGSYEIGGEESQFVVRGVVPTAKNIVVIDFPKADVKVKIGPGSRLSERELVHCQVVINSSTKND